VSPRPDLRNVLAPLSERDGVVVALLLTRDGLPVEMVGHGVRAEVLAAEAAALAASCRSAAERLMLGEAEDVTVSAHGYRLSCLPLVDHVLALVLAGGEIDAAMQAAREVVADLREALGGGS